MTHSPIAPDIFIDAADHPYYKKLKADLFKKKQERLTNGLRLYSPFYDNTNNKIYAINTYDGTSNLYEGNPKT